MVMVHCVLVISNMWLQNGNGNDGKQSVEKEAIIPLYWINKWSDKNLGNRKTFPTGPAMRGMGGGGEHLAALLFFGCKHDF